MWVCILLFYWTLSMLRELFDLLHITGNILNHHFQLSIARNSFLWLGYSMITIMFYAIKACRQVGWFIDWWSLWVNAKTAGLCYKWFKTSLFYEHIVADLCYQYRKGQTSRGVEGKVRCHCLIYLFTHLLTYLFIHLFNCKGYLLQEYFK